MKSIVTTKHRLAVLGVVAALAFSFGSTPVLANASPTQTRAITPGQPSGNEIFVVRNSHESFTDALERESAKDESFRLKALKLLEAWKSQLSAPANPVREKERRLPVDLSTIDNALAKTRSPQKDLSRKSAADASAFSFSIDDPNSYSVRGGPQGDHSYWIGEPFLEIDGDQCGLFGCETTDKFKVNITVNPGVSASMVNARTFYFPSSGRLSAPRLTMTALTSGRDVGWRPYALSAAGGETAFIYLNSYEKLSGRPLTVAVRLDMQTPNGPLGDGAKTADCIGRTGDDTRCFYG